MSQTPPDTSLQPGAKVPPVRQIQVANHSQPPNRRRMAKQIRINGRRFGVVDWAERFEPEQKIHACGKLIVGTFRVTLPRSVGIGAVVEMEGGERRAIVDEEEADETGEALVRGSILGVGPGVPLAEPSIPPPPANASDARAAGRWDDGSHE